MILTLIAAIGKNNELGKGNDLLWKLPVDQKHFRDRTSGHTIIMGRKTFESMGRPLPNRRNIVITRDTKYEASGTEITHSLEEALGLVKNTNEEVFIIGGGELYKQAILVANKLDITHIQAEDKDADAFFPEIIPMVWNEISHEEHKKDSQNPFNYTFSIYDKFI